MSRRPTEGEEAPDFCLPDERGEMFCLLEALNEGPIMLVFYPGDFTPVCTRQLCSYGDRYDDFRQLGLRIVGISDDPVEQHARFRREKDLPFTLLSDPDHRVIDQYGGSGLLSGGGAHRANFLIDSNGSIRYAHVEKISITHRRPEQLLQVARRLWGSPSQGNED